VQQVQRPQPPRAIKEQEQASAAPRPRGCKTVFVKNLPYDADEDVSLEHHIC
jgi:hypothetical protein